MAATRTLEPTRTAGVYRRGERYVVVWRHHGRQHKRFFPTLAQAREFKGQAAAGERRPPSREPLEAYARTWLETYRGRTSRGLAERTRSAYRAALLGRVIPFFGRTRLADVEPPDVRRLVDHLEREGLGPATIRKELAPLRAMFATALEDGAVRSNPTLGVRVSGPRHVELEDADQEPGRLKALTRPQLASLITELPETRRLFFELLAHSGVRISEALGLRCGDVALGARPVLRIRRQICRGELDTLKSGAGRRDIPLAPRMAERLRVETAGKPRDAPLFASSIGTPLRAENVRNRVLAPAAARAGVPWAGFHTLRHTCASMLFQAGKNIKQVQEWLGHSDPGFTLRTYVHLIDDGLGDADFLDAAVGSATKPPGVRQVSSEMSQEYASEPLIGA